MQTLKDLMKTRYITDDHIHKLNQVLSSVKEIDLADCKFTPGAERELRTFYSSVKMTNSRNTLLNRMLQHNCDAKQSDTTLKDAIPLKTSWGSPQEILDYISSLDRTKNYVMKEVSIKSISLVILLMLKFPEMTIDLGAYLCSVFEQVRMDWLQYKKSHDKYWLVLGTSALLLERDEKGDFVLPEGYRVAEHLLTRMYTVLPAEFGTVCLSDNEEFEEVKSNAIKNLLTTTASAKCMKDYIEFFD